MALLQLPLVLLDLNYVAANWGRVGESGASQLFYVLAWLL